MAKMDWKVITRASFIRNRQLTAFEKILYLDLCSYAGIKDECFPSQETLAKDLNVSSRTIIRTLSSLKAKGVLEWYKQNYKGRKDVHNVYQLLTYRTPGEVYDGSLRKRSIRDERGSDKMSVA